MISKDKDRALLLEAPQDTRKNRLEERSRGPDWACLYERPRWMRVIPLFHS